MAGIRNDGVMTARAQLSGLAVRRVKPRPSRLTRAQAHTGWLLIGPAGFVVLVFHVIPLLALIYFSLTNYSVFSPPKWVGFDNYVGLIQSEQFRTAMRNTVLYAAGYVFPNLVVALALALLLSQRIAGVGLFRSVYFLPVVVSTTSISVMGLWVFERQFGLVNYLLTLAGVPPQAWLLDESLAMPAIIAISVWQFVGYNVVIFMAGLNGIPEELYDAAKIDGAGPWARLLFVTLPLLAPITFYAFLTTTIYAFQVFVPVLVLTGGGPGVNSTSTVVLTIYRTAFQFARFGEASAMAVVLLVLVLVLTLINFRFFAPRETY
jgi:multiple sugar transport system permease protein